MLSTYTQGTQQGCTARRFRRGKLAILTLQVAIHELSKALPEDQRPLALERVEVNDNCSFWLPNAGVTGGSTAAEGSCEAVRLACKKLVRPSAAPTPPHNLQPCNLAVHLACRKLVCPSPYPQSEVPSCVKPLRFRFRLQPTRELIGAAAECARSDSCGGVAGWCAMRSGHRARQVLRAGASASESRSDSADLFQSLSPGRGNAEACGGCQERPKLDVGGVNWRPAHLRPLPARCQAHGLCAVRWHRVRQARSVPDLAQPHPAADLPVLRVPGW